MSADMIKTSPVEVEVEVFERFRRLHPQHGAWTWFVRTVLANYVALHTIDTEELLMIATQETTIKNS